MAPSSASHKQYPDMQLTLAKIEIVGLQDKSLFRVRVEGPYEASGLSDQCLSPITVE